MCTLPPTPPTTFFKKPPFTFLHETRTTKYSRAILSIIDSNIEDISESSKKSLDLPEINRSGGKIVRSIDLSLRASV